MNRVGVMRDNGVISLKVYDFKKVFTTSYSAPRILHLFPAVCKLHTAYISSSNLTETLNGSISN